QPRARQSLCLHGGRHRRHPACRAAAHGRRRPARPLAVREFAELNLRSPRPLRSSHVIGIVGLIVFYVLTFRVLSRTTFMPEHGVITLARYLSLTPPLLIMVATNGSLEELMFRGLLMSKLNLTFGPVLATFVQAIVFASWHVGVTYTSSALVFIVLFVLPLGLL